MRDLPRWRSLPTDPLDAQVDSHQRAGNTLRRVTQDQSAVVLLGIANIRDRRSMSGVRSRPQAFIIRSLKRPEEVDTLRRIFGDCAFFVVAAHAPITTRIENLAIQIARSRGSADANRYRKRAEELIQRDAAELDTPFGQNLRMTFPEADVIVDASKPDDLKEQLARVVRIIFSAPFETPTASEFAMFHAKAAALRSADLGRQVGAAIVNADGDVIAVGANEVPKAGGGLYWPDACRWSRLHATSKRQPESQARDSRRSPRRAEKPRMDQFSEDQRSSTDRRADRQHVEPRVEAHPADESGRIRTIRTRRDGCFTRCCTRGVSVKGADLYSRPPVPQLCEAHRCRWDCSSPLHRA